MKDTQLTGKRIVSKGEYAKVIGSRSVKHLWMYLVACLVVVFIMGALWGLFNAVSDIWASDLRAALRDAARTTVDIALTWALGQQARKLQAQLKAAETVVPLTRANSADLPAPESLVRASEEPLQAQHAVLLRAAPDSAQTPSEQLVRAAERPP